MQVCRSAGYYQHALYLAEQHHQHDWYLKIQLEDIKDYQKALDYIGKLDFEEVRAFWLKFSELDCHAPLIKVFNRWPMSKACFAAHVHSIAQSYIENIDRNSGNTGAFLRFVVMRCLVCPLFLYLDMHH